tara:strand:- start:410 stop:544 length:135 start_codon:yes stop_codon:yes gene_type:complete
VAAVAAVVLEIQEIILAAAVAAEPELLLIQQIKKYPLVMRLQSQ